MSVSNRFCFFAEVQQCGLSAAGPAEPIWYGLRDHCYSECFLPVVLQVFGLGRLVSFITRMIFVILSVAPA
jgi:hypothetical protein